MKYLLLALAAFIVIPGALIVGDKLGPRYPGQSTFVDLPAPYTEAQQVGLNDFIAANIAEIPMDWH